MKQFLSRALAVTLLLGSAVPAAAAPGHYAFAWSGDPDGKGEDFIAVIDADPASPKYGTLVTTAASGIRSKQNHHTEYWMPEGGLLFANDHKAGTTAVMDLRDPLHPRLHATFNGLAGFSHPHSFLRLPNGHVLASFQVEGTMHHGGDHDMAAMPRAGMPGANMPRANMPEMPDEVDIGAKPNLHGGVVEIDNEGRLVRAASTADPARPGDLLMAYSLLPLPDIDRVVVTNSGMRNEDRIGHTYQVFRLSDLKRLSTNDFDAPPGTYGETNPEEARAGPDGSVYVQTLGCGIERLTDLATDEPQSKLVWQFPGFACGVPTIVSHYLIQSVPILHGLVVLDIRDGAHPVEVARTAIDPAYQPHWTVYDPATHRVAVTGESTEDRLMMLKFDPDSGALSVDTAFHDAQGKPGFDFANRTWPHGWTGAAYAHGVVFSR